MTRKISPWLSLCIGVGLFLGGCKGSYEGIPVLPPNDAGTPNGERDESTIGSRDDAEADSADVFTKRVVGKWTYDSGAVLSRSCDVGASEDVPIEGKTFVLTKAPNSKLTLSGLAPGWDECEVIVTVTSETTAKIETQSCAQSSGATIQLSPKSGTLTLADDGSLQVAATYDTVVTTLSPVACTQIQDVSATKMGAE